MRAEGFNDQVREGEKITGRCGHLVNQAAVCLLVLLLFRRFEDGRPCDNLSAQCSTRFVTFMWDSFSANRLNSWTARSNPELPDWRVGAVGQHHMNFRRLNAAIS